MMVASRAASVCRGGAFDAAQQLGGGRDLGDVFEQRAKAPARWYEPRAGAFRMVSIRNAAAHAPARAARSQWSCSATSPQPAAHCAPRSTEVFRRPSRRIPSDVRSPRLLVLVALLAIVAAGTWYYLSHVRRRTAETLAVYYTKLDGTTPGADARLAASASAGRERGRASAQHRAVRRRASGRRAAERRAGDSFSAGHARSGRRASTGSTATIDLSKEVEQQAGGSFGENGEFKALVYTLTGVPGIDAVQILVEGNRLETLPGGHLELDQPLHRSDW